MKLYLIKLELCSYLVTPLQSDTIFGHLCWALANRYDEKFLKEFLSSENPAAIFSNGFPEGKLPRPILDPMTVPQRKQIKEIIKNMLKKQNQCSKNPDFEAEVILKKLKKKKWIDEKTWRSLSGDLNEQKLVMSLVDNFFKADREDEKEKQKKSEDTSPVEYHRERNIIDRITGSTLSEGGIFTVSETRYKNPNFDLYLLFDNTSFLKIDELKTLLDDVFEKSGYGADSSIGAGHFKINAFTEIDNQLPQDTSSLRVMSLSNFVPDFDSIEIDSLRYSLISKFGMLGDKLALHKNPFKKPVVMMQAGSTFKPKKPAPYFGKMLKNIHTNPAIVQNAALIPFYFKEASSQ